jgi:hypothetical protein
MAGDLHAALNAGAASRSCVEAEQLLATCISAADIDNGWRGVLQQELEDVARRCGVAAENAWVHVCSLGSVLLG